MTALAVSGLSVRFGRDAVPAVDDVSFSVAPGKTLGLIGPPGSGKSTVCRAAIRLLPPSASVTGSITLGGTEVTGLGERQMCRRRGREIALVPQSPSRSLDPTMRVGRQMLEALRGNRAEALDLLRRVGLADPVRVFDSLPHELSGGMCQRVLIAIAVAWRPRVLIADEATASLDARSRHAVLDLLSDLRQEMNLALVLVSHDLALVTGCADEIVRMDRGRVVEAAEPASVEFEPPGRASPGPSLIELVDVAVSRGHRAVLSGVNLRIGRGESLALVGERGSGKSTLAHSIMHGPEQFLLNGVRPAQLSIVFQDPLGSLDPTWRINAIVGEPVHGGPRRELVRDTLRLVGLDPDHWGRRRPRELSGGQAQLVAIARALITSPALLICDEAVSSLDPPTRRRILTLLRNRQKEFGMSWLMITHDRAIADFCDRVVVLHEGRLTEPARMATT